MPEKKRRVRDSTGSRNIYDSIKNFKSSLNSNKNIFQGNEFEPSITITVQNNSSRGSKRKSLDQSKADILKNEKLLKKQEEVTYLFITIF